jgi:precorrin-3B C17-methyltransferase
MSGKLTVVGLGPSGTDYTTPAVLAAIEDATDVFGYVTYVDRLPPAGPYQQRHPSDNRVEIERARAALALAAEGRRVVMVSGGDPGVFAMAAAVFEALEHGLPEWRALDVRVEPGITAMLAAAALAGAPLGGDFCAISLSDNLKSWSTIERRLEAAARGDFVIALYNPASRARPEQLGRAFEFLRRHKAADTVVLFARAAGGQDAALQISDLGSADHRQADMRTLVMIGSSQTRLIARRDQLPWVYTPRSEQDRAS